MMPLDRAHQPDSIQSAEADAQKLTLRCLVIARENAFRERICSFLEGMDDALLVGSTSNGYYGMLLAALGQPDVVFLGESVDFTHSGQIAADALLRLYSSLNIVFLVSREESSRFSSQSALAYGVQDYLYEDAGEEDVRRALRGFRTSEEQDVSHLVEDNRMYALSLLAQMRPSQLELLRHLAEGKSVEEYAEKRGRSVEKVSQSAQDIYRLFGCSTQMQLQRTLHLLMLDNFL